LGQAGRSALSFGLRYVGEGGSLMAGNELDRIGAPQTAIFMPNGAFACFMPTPRHGACLCKKPAMTHGDLGMVLGWEKVACFMTLHDACLT
jgi:hypothetical protein